MGNNTEVTTSDTPSKNNLEAIEGQIERITFHNESNGFFVIRIKVKRQRDLITLVGKAPSLLAGEYVKAEGHWFNDSNHGLQFQCTHFMAIQPTTREGIERYLGSGLIKGIGPHFAKRLVEHFGEDVFSIIEQNPERLKELDGIGSTRQAVIKTAWKEQVKIREIMVFLHSHNVSTSRSFRIYKTYGDTAIDKVKQNPYQLAKDIEGIGFKTADQLAQQLGVPQDSPLRAQAGLKHVLQEHSNDGHIGITINKLLDNSIELLNISKDVLTTAIEHQVSSKELIYVQLEDREYLALASLFTCEQNIAERLIALGSGQSSWHDINCDKVIPWLEERNKLKFSNSQNQAIREVVRHKIAIITGGPGVGKTTIIKSITDTISAKQGNILLCAPTGRAAKRLSEATGLTAKTIHRLLEFDPSQRGFRFNQETPLMGDYCIVDEVSMVDAVLMHQLLKAIPNNMGLLLVGDIDQLPSVGPGNVLADLIHSNTIPTIRLTEIFRQVASSDIIKNAHRINQGQLPHITNKGENSDCFIVHGDSPDDIKQKLLAIVSQRIPKKFTVDPIKDIQVLTPTQRGGLGARSLNLELQALLNPNPSGSIKRYGQTYAVGDKVIQVVNNYDKAVFNGDIGRINEIDMEEEILFIEIDGEVLQYNFNELDELQLAYATSIHKSQGSEYPVVVIPLAMQHYMLLQRNLLYTGLTRGKQLVVLIAEPKALKIAISKKQAMKRITFLEQHLNNQ